jgi:energy-coupling factor transporter ATP-binding protein EcfA2
MGWALDIVGATKLVNRDLDTLSGGEKQKVAIAAMMATKPRILIFDEPTSNLDPSATAEIFNVIERIRALSRITVIVIEHKLGYLQSFKPRLIKMKVGQIIHDAQMSETRSLFNPMHPVAPPKKSKNSDTCLIRVDNLLVTYGKKSALHNISLKVMAGDFVSVMGDNGSGKTTLLYCLLGLHQPEGGKVDVHGKNTRSMPVSELARTIGFVFQNPDHQLFADSVWEEATFALRNFGLLDQKTEAYTSDLLERCGLYDYRRVHPYRLSYGEKRRLNLISVLCYGPRLLLLDEILIGQDPDNASFLLDLLYEFTVEGGGVMMVNHAPEITRCYANRIVFLDRGRILVDAPTPEAFVQLHDLGKDAYVV